MPVIPPSGPIFDETGEHVLASGDLLPRLTVVGWLHGEPSLPPESTAALTVVDVWNDICTVCHEAAPGLQQIQQKYAEQGVCFVGVTTRGRGDAEAFVARHGIEWPNGYGAANLPHAAPQVFVVDREGIIVWHDGRLRFFHQPERFCRELDAAIENALPPIGG